jgi:two-component system chemotaxis response regulator CheB
MNSVSAVRESLPTRVLVVDDSAVVRGLISRQLSEDPMIEVVSTAANGERALAELARHAIDLVVLDIEMPVMDGLTALGRIVREHPGVRVVMASTLTVRNAEISLKALQLGASDCIAKPQGGLTGADEFKRELIQKVKSLGARRSAALAAAAHPLIAPPAPAARQAPFSSRIKPTALAIGASTGGPPVLLKLFEQLRGSIKQPIFLTQHMPATFTTLLAEQLSRAGDRPCAEGRDGEPVQAGRCYVAPGGWHMTVERDGALPVIRLNQEPPENFCRPAVDPMLRSVSRVYGAGVVAAIFTGMGNDGAKGCEAVAKAGGRFIVQDEATSVVWGMPGAAAATGLAESILPVSDMAPWLLRSMEIAR